MREHRGNSQKYKLNTVTHCRHPDSRFASWAHFRSTGSAQGKGGSGLKTLREGHGVHIEMLSQQQAGCFKTRLAPLSYSYLCRHVLRLHACHTLSFRHGTVSLLLSFLMYDHTM